MSQNNVVALIVAGGKGSRLGGSIPKQYHQLQGKTILWHSVKAFLDHPLVDQVMVVFHPEHEEEYTQAVEGLSLLPPAYAGKERKDSVCNGLDALKHYHPDKILIHDAARPFITKEVITAVIENIAEGQGAAPVIAVEDTLKQVDGAKISGTVDRAALRRIQTPQGFLFDEIHTLHHQYKKEAVTDDVAMFELAGKNVVAVHGSKYNFKITDREDIHMASMLMSQAVEYRTGQGFDVHAFCDPKQPENNSLRLGGIDIPYEKSLKGHSDADVVLHALTDAILGAIGQKDIGYHFPPSDNSFKNMDSAIFLEKAKTLVEEQQGRIIHVDVTIICQVPKITPHREAMEERIAAILAISPSRVSVKATTTEKLGFTGRKEGIAVQAVATVTVPFAEL